MFSGRKERSEGGHGLRFPTEEQRLQPFKDPRFLQFFAELGKERKGTAAPPESFDPEDSKRYQKNADEAYELFSKTLHLTEVYVGIFCDLVRGGGVGVKDVPEKEFRKVLSEFFQREAIRDPEQIEEYMSKVVEYQLLESQVKKEEMRFENLVGSADEELFRKKAYLLRRAQMVAFPGRPGRANIRDARQLFQEQFSDGTKNHRMRRVSGNESRKRKYYKAEYKRAKEAEGVLEELTKLRKLLTAAHERVIGDVYTASGVHGLVKERLRETLGGLVGGSGEVLTVKQFKENLELVKWVKDFRDKVGTEQEHFFGEGFEDLAAAVAEYEDQEKLDTKFRSLIRQIVNGAVVNIGGGYENLTKALRAVFEVQLIGVDKIEMQEKIFGMLIEIYNEMSFSVQKSALYALLMEISNSLKKEEIRLDPISGRKERKKG